MADRAEGFLAFFEPIVARNPVLDIVILRIFEDGPWVFCSAYQSLNEGATQWVTMDLFYTDPAGLILEHWDTISPFVAETASGAPIGAARAGYQAWLSSPDFGAYEMLFQLIGQGDFVATYGKRRIGENSVAVFDLYRVADGKIAEHWMNEEEISPRDAWGNSGKF
ncbi:MAG: hypothetical protein AB8B51_00955 [Sedimentitalea sp.]